LESPRPAATEHFPKGQKIQKMGETCSGRGHITIFQVSEAPSSIFGRDPFSGAGRGGLWPEGRNAGNPSLVVFSAHFRGQPQGEFGGPPAVPDGEVLRCSRNSEFSRRGERLFGCCQAAPHSFFGDLDVQWGTPPFFLLEEQLWNKTLHPLFLLFGGFEGGFLIERAGQKFDRTAPPVFGFDDSKRVRAKRKRFFFRHRGDDPNQSARPPRKKPVPSPTGSRRPKTLTPPTRGPRPDGRPSDGNPPTLAGTQTRAG